MECVVLFHIETNGKIRVEVKNLLLKRRMDTRALRMVKEFSEQYKEKIVKKWVEIQVYKKNVKTELITRRVK